MRYILCNSATDFGMGRLGGDAPKGWKTGYVITLLIMGVSLIAVFLWWQSVFKYPLMPLYLWKDRNFSLVRE